MTSGFHKDVGLPFNLFYEEHKPYTKATVYSDLPVQISLALHEMYMDWFKLTFYIPVLLKIRMAPRRKRV